MRTVAGDAAAGQYERAIGLGLVSFIFPIAAEYAHAAATVIAVFAARAVAGDAAAGHGKGATRAHLYAAAVLRLVAGDVAARKGEAGS